MKVPTSRGIKSAIKEYIHVDKAGEYILDADLPAITEILDGTFINFMRTLKYNSDGVLVYSAGSIRKTLFEIRVIKNAKKTDTGNKQARLKKITESISAADNHSKLSQHPNATDIEIVLRKYQCKNSNKTFLPGQSIRRAQEELTGIGVTSYIDSDIDGMRCFCAYGVDNQRICIPILEVEDDPSVDEDIKEIPILSRDDISDGTHYIRDGGRIILCQSTLDKLADKIIFRYIHQDGFERYILAQDVEEICDKLRQNDIAFKVNEIRSYLFIGDYKKVIIRNKQV